MTKLFVGNLSFGTTEDTLRHLFEEGGRVVQSVAIIMDRATGQSRGFGFVEMGSPADAEAAMAELDNHELDGRKIRVNEARERERRGGGGGGGRRSRGGGRRGGGGGGRW